MTDTMQRADPGARRPKPARDDVGVALAALSGEDLLRLRAVARLRARALPGGVGWSDLLQEAVCRALAGARLWPAGVPLIAFLAGIMRSLSHEHWRRHRLGQAAAALPAVGGSDDPERAYAATQALAALHALFASDETASAVIRRVDRGHDGGGDPGALRPRRAGVRHDAQAHPARDAPSRAGVVMAVRRAPGLTALLDALEQDLLAAPATELREVQRATGRAWNTSCQEVRSLLHAAMGRSEEDIAATAPPRARPCTTRLPPRLN